MQSLPWGFKARYKTEGFHFSLNEETESQGDEPPQWWHSSFRLFLHHTAGMSLKQPPWEILHGQAILQCFSDDMICKGQREILDPTLSVEVTSNSFPFLAHTSPKCASLLTGENICPWWKKEDRQKEHTEMSEKIPSSSPKYPRDVLSPGGLWIIFQEHMCESSKETEHKVPWSVIACLVDVGHQNPFRGIRNSACIRKECLSGLLWLPGIYHGSLSLGGTLNLQNYSGSQQRSPPPDPPPSPPFSPPSFTHSLCRSLFKLMKYQLSCWPWKTWNDKLFLQKDENWNQVHLFSSSGATTYQPCHFGQTISFCSYPTSYP